MSDEVRANTDDLSSFVESGRAFRSSLEEIREDVGRHRSMAADSLDGTPPASAEPVLVELINRVVISNEFVEAVLDTLLAFETDDDPMVTVSGDVVAAGLEEAGFSGLLDPSTRRGVANLAASVDGDGLDAEGGVADAGAAYVRIASEIDKGDDLGMSNGELNQVQSQLAGLDVEGQELVFATLSDEQLEVLFHNVHSSSRWSNDWDDRERGEFYDVIWGLDQTTRDRLAAHSPWLEVGSPSREASEARALVMATIDKGDDLGMSNGELNEVQSILADLDPDEAEYVFGELSADQLNVLFHNAHGSGAWSNDWDDRERGEFYDVIFAMDQPAIDRLAAHSPWIQVGIPSREAGQALGVIEGALGDGTSFDVSVGEMNTVSDAFEGLNAEEIGYVLDNLSDDQLESMIHNAHPTGFWSNDWSDGQREEFFGHFDAYLDDLVANGVYEGAPGEYPTAAETDNLIRTYLPADYIAVPVANGQQADGNLAIVGEANYALARGRSTGRPVPDNNNGFADRGREQQWVRVGHANYGTPIHEALHFYSDPDFRQEFRTPLNEGATEYFTHVIVDQLDDPATTTVDEASDIAHDRRNIYSDNLAFTEDLVNVVGEDILAAAYFEGDIAGLEAEYIAVTGRTADEWESMIEHVKKEEWDEAEELLKPAGP